MKQDSIDITRPSYLTVEITNLCRDLKLKISNYEVKPQFESIRYSRINFLTLLHFAPKGIPISEFSD